MLHETEIKLKYKSRKEIKKLLESLGAKPKEKYLLHDTYFTKNKDISNKNELIRIREKGKNYELTFKGKCKAKGNIWKRVELTSQINNPKTISKILLLLGFFKTRENISFRETYNLNKLEIAFIDFKRPIKLSIIEIEGNENKIKQLLKKLGNSVRQIGEEAFKKFDKNPC